MRCLVSICNKGSRQEFQEQGTFLFEVDTDREAVRPIRLDHPRSKAALGVNGLAHYQGGILLVPQNAQQLVRLDPQLAVSDVWDVPDVTGGHSIAVNGSKAHVVCARTDSIVEFDPACEPRWFWRANEEGVDTLHMNSALWVGDTLYLSAFGPKPDKQGLWSTATQGSIVDVAANRRIVEPIHHPHSLAHFDGKLYWCESAKMAVCNQSGQRLEVGRGYVRGLVITEDLLIVGVSRGRNMSMSMDRPVASSPFRETTCGILVYRHDRTDLAKSTLLAEISLQAYGDEIYDILPLAITASGNAEHRTGASAPTEVAGPQSPKYTVLLEQLHRWLEPRLYVEIGVRHGRSLRLARGPAVGVDPAAQLDEPLPASATLVAATSDEFFQSAANAVMTSPIDLAFIDGMHLFEYALRDFMNLERRSATNGVIVFDDIFPFLPIHAERERQSGVWMGDVWKIVPILREYRPELTCIPVDVATGGLLIVGGLDPLNHVLVDNYDEIVDRYSTRPLSEVPANVIARSGAATADDPRLASICACLRGLRDQAPPAEQVRAALMTQMERRSPTPIALWCLRNRIPRGSVNA